MGKRVLIAEDSSVILNLTKKILEQENMEIAAAKNGVEVLKKLDGEDFDVILMDINMPKMDGMECARQIRALSDKDAGINEYLPKPLDFDNLVTLVHKYTS